MIRLKKGVSLRGLRAEILFALTIAESIWTQMGAPDLVVTSGADGKHSVGSFHYVGLAVDIRTYNLPGGYKGLGAQEAVKQLRDALGEEYDVILESTHVHIEYQPKYALK